jgi:hypothetical protein
MTPNGMTNEECQLNAYDLTRARTCGPLTLIFRFEAGSNLREETGNERAVRTVARARKPQNAACEAGPIAPMTRDCC